MGFLNILEIGKVSGNVVRGTSQGLVCSVYWRNCLDWSLEMVMTGFRFLVWFVIAGLPHESLMVSIIRSSVTRIH